MNELKSFFEELITPIVQKAIDSRLQKLSTEHADPSPYGDFKWLQSVCIGIPAGTLRVKSAQGQIPGVSRIGKRVIYRKASVLEWLDSGDRKQTLTERLERAAERERIAEEQFNRKHTKP